MSLDGPSSMKVSDTVEAPFRGQAIDQNRGVPSVMVTDTKIKEKFTLLRLDPRLLPLMKVLIK